MKFCPKCGDKIADNFTFCPSCGTDLIQFEEDIEKSHIIDKDSMEEPVQEISLEESASEVVEEINDNKKGPGGEIWEILALIFLGGCIALFIFFIFILLGNPLDGVSNHVTTISTTPPIKATPTQVKATPTQPDKISILTKIVDDYHKIHTYSKYDLFVCSDMAIDVWNIVETQGINAKIQVGNVDDPNAKPENYNHAWVLAEVEPFSYVALETTGGYLVWGSENNNYFQGYSFDNPKELKDYLDKLQHPCPEGYVLGNDNLCHQACGGNTYCTGNSICVNGLCRECNPGYILGQDLQCHQACGVNTYCTGNNVCINGECRGCNSGYVVGDDMQCHPECGSGHYCTGNSICVNGQCRGCTPGYVLGDDMQCHPECGSGQYCPTGTCFNGECIVCNPGYYLGTDGRCYHY